MGDHLLTLCLQAILTALVASIARSDFSWMLLPPAVLVVGAAVWYQIRFVTSGTDQIRGASAEKCMKLSLWIPGAGQALAGHREWGLFLNCSLLLTMMAQWYLSKLLVIPLYSFAERAFSVNFTTDPLLGVLEPQTLVLFAASLPIWLPLYLFNLWDCRQKTTANANSWISDGIVILYSFLIPGFGCAYTGSWKSARFLFGLAVLSGLIIQMQHWESVFAGIAGSISILLGIVSGIWGFILVMKSISNRERITLIAVFGGLILLLAGVGMIQAKRASVSAQPYFIEMDENGTVLKELRLGGKAMARTKDGGFVITNQLYQDHGTKANTRIIRFIILDRNLKPVLQKNITGQGELWAETVLQDKNGDFLVVASSEEGGGYGKPITYYDNILTLDAKGNVKSRNRAVVRRVGNYDGLFYNTLSAWLENDGIMVIGVIEDLGNQKVLIQRYTRNDYTVLKTFLIDQLVGDSVILKTKTGNILCGTDSRVLLQLLDLNGNQIWAKKVAFESQFEIRALLETDDGGFLAVGNTERNVHNFAQRDLVLLKTDAGGSIQWRRRIQTEASISNSGYGRNNCAAVQLKNGDYMIAAPFGYVPTDSIKDPTGIRVLVLDRNGRVRWKKDLDARGTGETMILQTFGNHVVLTGQ